VLVHSSEQALEFQEFFLKACLEIVKKPFWLESHQVFYSFIQKKVVEQIDLTFEYQR